MFSVAYVIRHFPCTCWLGACCVCSLNCDWRQNYADHLQFAASREIDLDSAGMYPCLEE